MSGENPNRILVIGGGFSGLTAGIEAAETGAEVIVVEKILIWVAELRS